MGSLRRKLLMGCMAFGMAIAAGCSSGGGSEAKSESAPQMGGAGESGMTSRSEVVPPAFAVQDQYGMANASAPMAPAANAAAPSPPGPGLPPGGSGTFDPSVSRMLIYTANVTMQVNHYGDAYSEVHDLIHLSGGYIVQFSEQTAGSEKSGYFTVKVPAGGFSGFIEKLEEIPHVSMNRSMRAQDVSEEYVDLEARLQAKLVVEARYLEYMQQAEKADELIRYTNELAAVQEQIEQFKGRMRYLESNVAYSTVELRIYERIEKEEAKPEDGPSLADRMRDALKNSVDVLLSMAEGIMILIAGAIPIAVAAAAIGYPVFRIVRRKRKNSQDMPTDG